MAADLRRIAVNQWPSLAMTSMLGVMVYIVVFLWNGVFFQERGIMDIGTRTFFLAVASIVFVLYMPTKSYGHITDRRKGGAYLLLPASAFEKWLSMILNCIIIIPAAFIIIYLGSDALLCLVDRNCGESIFSHAFLNPAVETPNVFNMFNGTFIYCILAFLLGATVFRKHKAAKTALCLILLAVAFLMIGESWLVSSITDTVEAIQDTGDTSIISEELSWVNTLKTVTEILLTAGLAAGLYFRVRTIKH